MVRDGTSLLAPGGEMEPERLGIYRSVILLVWICVFVDRRTVTRDGADSVVIKLE